LTINYDKISDNKGKLKLGIVKLKSTEATVESLKKELEISKPELEKKNADTKILIKEVFKRKGEATI
jgi:hypothetical protein